MALEERKYYLRKKGFDENRVNLERIMLLLGAEKSKVPDTRPIGLSYSGKGEYESEWPSS